MARMSLAGLSLDTATSRTEAAVEDGAAVDAARMRCWTDWICEMSVAARAGVEFMVTAGESGVVIFERQSGKLGNRVV